MMLKNYWPVLAWSLIILILTGIPVAEMPKVGNLWDWIGSDKLAHFFLFAIYFYLLIKSTSKQLKLERLPVSVLIYLLLIGIIFAGLTEVLQDTLFINRNGNIYDFVANVIGCMAGLTIYLMATKKKQIK